MLVFRQRDIVYQAEGRGYIFSDGICLFVECVVFLLRGVIFWRRWICIASMLFFVPLDDMVCRVFYFGLG